MDRISEIPLSKIQKLQTDKVYKRVAVSDATTHLLGLIQNYFQLSDLHHLSWKSSLFKMKKYTQCVGTHSIYSCCRAIDLTIIS